MYTTRKRVYVPFTLLKCIVHQYAFMFDTNHCCSSWNLNNRTIIFISYRRLVIRKKYCYTQFKVNMYWWLYFSEWI